MKEAVRLIKLCELLVEPNWLLKLIFSRFLNIFEGLPKWDF